MGLPTWWGYGIHGGTSVNGREPGVTSKLHKHMFIVLREALPSKPGLDQVLLNFRINTSHFSRFPDPVSHQPRKLSWLMSVAFCVLSSLSLYIVEGRHESYLYWFSDHSGSFIYWFSRLIQLYSIQAWSKAPTLLQWPSIFFQSAWTRQLVDTKEHYVL